MNNYKIIVVCKQTVTEAIIAMKAEVMRLCKDGWIPQGGASVVSPKYCKITGDYPVYRLYYTVTRRKE